jgi:hypothetical protein
LCLFAQKLQNLKFQSQKIKNEVTQILIIFFGFVAVKIEARSPNLDSPDFNFSQARTLNLRISTRKFFLSSQKDQIIFFSPSHHVYIKQNSDCPFLDGRYCILIRHKFKNLPQTMLMCL